MTMKPDGNSEVQNIALWRNFYNVWKRLQRGASENLSSMDISFLDYRILRYLKEYGKVPMVRISDFLLVTQGHITGVIDVMEEKGFVQRSRSAEDRRVINIELTAKGIETEHKARKSHEDYMGEVFGVYDPDEKATLHRSLLKLYSYLENP